MANLVSIEDFTNRRGYKGYKGYKDYRGDRGRFALALQNDGLPHREPLSPHMGAGRKDIPGDELQGLHWRDAGF